jgi:transketolase
VKTSLDELKGFSLDELSPAHLRMLSELRGRAAANIVRMVQCAGSGHLGGSLSSLDMLLMLFLCANVSPGGAADARRDRIVVSHGHISSALYTVLGLLGYVDLGKADADYRRDGSLFEGHPNKDIPGVEWASGSLGQGLSVGCGFALSARIHKRDNRVFVLMGDGEQQKGQIHEAAIFASKYQLNNLTAIVDLNGLQSSGAISEVMPQDIAGLYRHGKFRVVETDGHDFNAIYLALKSCYAGPKEPTLILARTVMGKGVPLIENDFRYHGKLLSKEEYAEFTRNGGSLPILPVRPAATNPRLPPPRTPGVESGFSPGVPRVYGLGKSVDLRDAFGAALADLFKENVREKGAPMVAIDCDLIESTRLAAIRDEYPGNFVECGIAEHNAATLAAALSRDGCVPFFVDFGVFGLDETYGQHRMSDFNKTSLKLVITHTGLEVGQDGKTHQCIDYISLLNNLYGYKLIVPADGNQADRAIRYVATHEGNFVVAIGRSPKPTLWDAERKSAIYGQAYDFSYGKSDWLREGNDACIVACGPTVYRALEISDSFSERGTRIAVLNVSCPKKIRLDDIRKAAATGLVLTYEDHNIQTGIGSIIGAMLAENGLACSFRRFGIKKYGLSAEPEYQYAAQGMSRSDLEEEIATRVVERLSKGKGES